MQLTGIYKCLNCEDLSDAAELSSKDGGKTWQCQKTHNCGKCICGGEVRSFLPIATLEELREDPTLLYAAIPDPPSRTN